MSAFAVILSGSGGNVAAATIESIEPQTITFGKATNISVGISGTASNDVQIALAPGGPYQRAHRVLPQPARDLAIYNDHVIIADGPAGLTTASLDAIDATDLQVLLADEAVAVRISGSTAYVLTTGRALLVLDLSQTGKPIVRERYPLRAEVRGFAVDEHLICLLYSDNELVVLNTAAEPSPANRATSIRPVDEITHVAVHQGVVYAATAGGVLLFDLGDEVAFGAAGVFKLLDGAAALTPRDTLLLVAGRNGGLTVLDIAEPLAPRWVASHRRVGMIRSMVADGDDVLMLREDGQLVLMDLASPTMPTIVSSYRPGAAAHAVTMRDRRVLVASADSVIDVDFTADPPLLSNELLDIGQGVNFGGQRRAWVDGNLAYVADWFSGIHIYDIADASMPRLLSTLRTPGSPKGIVVRDGIAYVADDDHGIQVVDVTDERNPRIVANLSVSGLAYTPRIVADRLYLASHRGGFQIIDITTPREPRVIAEIDTPGKAWSIEVDDNIAYVADDDAGLLMFDVRDPDHVTQIGAFATSGRIEEVLIDSQLAYIASFDDGIYVVDVSAPAQPRELAHVKTPGNARGLDLQGTKLYVADWLAGVHVINVAQPDHPAIIASFDTDGAAWGVNVSGDRAVVSDWWGGLVTLDVADPARPRLAARYNGRGRIQQVSAFDNYLVAAHGAGGVQVFDIRNGLNPTWVTSVETAADAMRLSIVDDVAYVGLKGGGIALIDLHEPINARQIGMLDYAGTVERMLIAGQWLYVLDRASGVTIFDVEQRRRPERVGGYPGRINDFFTDGNVMFAAMPNREILILDVSDPQNLELKQRVQLAYEPARLAGSREYLVGYDRQQMSIYSRRGSSIAPNGKAIPLADARAVVARGAQLFAIGADGVFRSWIVETDEPLKIGSRYTLASPLQRFFIYRDVAYFAGGDVPTAVQLLPPPRSAAISPDHVRVAAPPELPIGAYDMLLGTTSGAEERRNNAVTVAMPRFSKPKFTLEDLERVMKQQKTDSVPTFP